MIRPYVFYRTELGIGPYFGFWLDGHLYYGYESLSHAIETIVRICTQKNDRYDH